MPVPLSYPGVYIEEISSGVRPITGVATSITAFIGRAKRGPEDRATTINNYADYERTFGGLSLTSAMSFAVRDFFLNGGGQAVVVRLYHPDNDPATDDVATIDVDGTTLSAASPGEWGNELEVEVNHAVSQETADAQGIAVNELFNLIVLDRGTGGTEEHLNVSVIAGPRQLDRVLENDSKLATVTTLAVTRPAPASYQVSNTAADGLPLEAADYIGLNYQTDKKGLYALELADLFNLLCLPPDWANPESTTYPAGVLDAAGAYCEQRRAIMLVDPDPTWNDTQAVLGGLPGIERFKNAALYFPRLRQPNMLHDNQMEEFTPSGAVAGVISRTDSERGVWKAPAGLDASFRGVPELAVQLTDDDNGHLNKLGVNCLRAFPVGGRVVWGARTLKGADQLASEWKYLPVRRTALFIEETLFRGLLWVVHEPNDEPLWAQIRLNVTAFMNGLFRQGAFQGQTAREAYLVKCDSETTTQDDVNKGIVNIVVGFAPLKPAEFVIIKLQQLAGQTVA